MSSRPKPGLLDQIRFAPSEKQWRGDENRIQRGTYTSCRFFALFGITSARWDRLVMENKEAAQ